MSLNLQAVSDAATDQNFRQLEDQFPIQGANLAVGTKWIAPTFQNSWANYEAAGSYMPAAYRKGVDGRVTIRGLVKHAAATGTSVIFTLPAGFRPSKNLLFPCWATAGGVSAALRVDVASTGEVIVQAPTVATEYLSINLSFYPD